MNLFTNCLGCLWSCLRLSKLYSGRSRRAGVWRSAAGVCLGGLTPSGGEAGEPVHEDVVTFGFLSSSHTCVWSEMLFQLSCFCCRWVFHCRWGPQTLTRTCRGYLPRCFSGKGEGKQGRQEQSSSTDWGRGCVWLPWELQESPGEVIPEGGKGLAVRERGTLISCWCWGVLSVCLAVLGHAAPIFPV